MNNCFQYIEDVIKSTTEPFERQLFVNLIMHYIGNELTACFSSMVDFIPVSSEFTVNKLVNSGRCNFGYTEYTKRSYVSGESCHFGNGFYKCIGNTKKSPTEATSKWKQFTIGISEEVSYLRRNSSVYRMDGSIENGFDRRCDVFKYHTDGIMFTYGTLTGDYMMTKCYSASAFEEYLNANGIYEQTRRKLLINMEKERQSKLFVPSLIRSDITEKSIKLLEHLSSASTSEFYSDALKSYVTGYMHEGNHLPVYFGTIDERGRGMNELMRRIYPTSVEASSYANVMSGGFDHYSTSFLISNGTKSTNDPGLLISTYLSAGKTSKFFEMDSKETMYNELGNRGGSLSNNHAYYYGYRANQSFKNQMEYLLDNKDSSVNKFIEETMRYAWTKTAFVQELTSDHYFSSTAKSAYFDEVYDIIFPS